MDLSRNHFQRNSSWNAPYTFSGKEKDAETGYGYVKKLRFFSSLAFGNEKQVFHYAHCLRRFGARYYDSGLSVWLSVDPLSDKYPTLSPYTYCANNPIMMVDPDGRRMSEAAMEFSNNLKTKLNSVIGWYENRNINLKKRADKLDKKIFQYEQNGDTKRLNKARDKRNNMNFEFENTNECIRLLKSVIETIDYYQREDTEELSFVKRTGATEGDVEKTNSGYQINYLDIENCVHELVHLGDGTIGEDVPNWGITASGFLGCIRSLKNSREEKAYNAYFAFQYGGRNLYYWLSSTRTWMEDNNKLITP